MRSNAPGTASADARTDAFARERADLLAAWMPALLHRLNNAAGVVDGMAELWADGAGSSAAHARSLREQSRVVVDVLRLFAAVALPRSDARGALDVHELAREPLELIDLLHRTQMRAALRERRGLTVVRARADELLLLLSRVLHAATPSLWERSARGDPDLALRVCGDRTRVRLLLRCRETDGFDALAAHAAALGGSLRTRRFAGRPHARIVWPGVDARGPA